MGKVPYYTKRGFNKPGSARSKRLACLVGIGRMRCQEERGMEGDLNRIAGALRVEGDRDEINMDL